MNTNIIVVGVNHKSAPVEIREKLAFSEKKLVESLKNLYQHPLISENVILSTCNRVEIYAQVEDIENGIISLKKFFTDYHEIPMQDLDEHFYVYINQETIEHLFSVSSSLDSMVVGEPQILGQVKSAYAAARDKNAAGVILSQLFEKSFSVAKKVRTETAIAEKAVSISFAAVELAKKIFDDLKNKVVLLIGAGEMSELAARHLLASGVNSILVSSRNFERAVELARGLNGSAIRFENFTDELIRTDIVISSTSAPHSIIRKDAVETAIHERKNKPMFFIDIAVPRDIEPEVNDVENVYLYNIDDLREIVDANQLEREKEAEEARKLIKIEVELFSKWLESLKVTPTITSIREQAEKIRVTEMEKTFSKLKDLTETQKSALESMTSSIVNKILHKPTVKLREQTEEKQGHWYIQVVRHLFHLDQ
ncbi:MAG: glutamyl-tRNA reductase [Nitrospinota bacterium]|nr:glutamyl-tRNA reductase [Nitrospinota bacterium]